MAIKPIPEGYHSVTPYLVVQGVARLIDFLTQAFDAEEVHRTADATGTVRHAEIKIGDSHVMLGESSGAWAAMPCAMYLYVRNVDATYKQAIKAGATSLGEPADQFYGDRSAGVKDFAGNIWWIATHVEDVSNEEIGRRAAAKVKE